MSAPRLRLLASFALLALTACSANHGADTVLPHTANVNGKVFGGQQPVSGATIQLYAVGTSGDGSPAIPLITSTTVTTDPNGNFSLTGTYSCTATSATSNASLVYVTATGGNPGLGGNLTNPNLTEMVALGPCGQLTPTTFILIDEVTTVAAASALSPFGTSYLSIGSASGDATSLQAAFALAAEFANAATGTSPGINVPVGFTVPAAEINTLADILSYCVNSPGGTTAGTPCGMLFSLTTPPGSSTPPSNTIDAILSLANNPTLNTVNLFGLTPSSPPYQPELFSAPPNFAVALQPADPATTLSLTPTSISFPNTTVGYTSAAQTITIQNTGSAPAIFSGISLTGMDASEFTQVSDCTSPMQPGASCSVQITAAPTAAGANAATLIVAANTVLSPQTASLTVAGSSPSAGPITLSTSSLSWTIAGTLEDVVLSNLGTTALSFKSITSSNASFVVANNTCGNMLPAQSLCTISVQSNSFGGLTPTTVNGTLTIQDDATAGPQTVTLTSRNSMQVRGSVFSTTSVGSSSQITVLVQALTNGGQASFTGSISGTNASDFSPALVGCTGSGGYGFMASCSFPLTFTPTANGTRTAQLVSSGYIPLTGIGTGGSGAFFISPASASISATVNYNSVATGSTVVSVLNAGSTTLNFSSFPFFSATPAYFQTSGNCSAVAPGTMCSVIVSFSASVTGAGSYTGTLTLMDATSGITRYVPVTASTGYAYPSISPSSYTFPSTQSGSTSSEIFTVGDYGGNPLGYAVSILPYGTPTPGYSVSPTSCPANTTALCTFTVTFAPTAAGSSYAAFQVTGLAPTGVAAVLAITGTATPPPTTGAPAVTFAPNPLTFPARPVNSTSLPSAVTLTNSGTGNAPLAISGITIVGGSNNNFIQTNNCPANLATGASCAISVTFAPTNSGSQSASLQVTSNATTSPDQLLISGSTP